MNQDNFNDMFNNNNMNNNNMNNGMNMNNMPNNNMNNGMNMNNMPNNNMNNGMNMNNMPNNNMNNGMYMNNMPNNMMNNNKKNSFNMNNIDFNKLLKNKKVLIGAAVAGVVLVAGIGLLVFNQPKNKVSREIKKIENTSKEILKNIQIEKVSKLSNGDMVIAITNNSKKQVNTFFELDLYDDDGVKVDHAYVNIGCFNPGDTAYDYIYADSDFSTFKIAEEGFHGAYEGDKSNYAVCVKPGSVTASVSKLPGEYSSYQEVLVKNSSDKKLNYSAVVLYKKNGSIVGARQVMTSVDANGSAKEKVLDPYDDNYDLLPYDTVELKVNDISGESSSY